MESTNNIDLILENKFRGVDVNGTGFDHLENDEWEEDGWKDLYEFFVNAN